MRLIKYFPLLLAMFSAPLFAAGHLDAAGYRALALTALQDNAVMFRNLEDRMARFIEERPGSEQTDEFRRVYSHVQQFIARSWEETDRAVEQLVSGAPTVDVLRTLIRVNEDQYHIVIFGENWNGIESPKSAIGQAHRATVYLFELINCGWQSLPNCHPGTESPNLTPSEQEKIYISGQLISNIWLQQDKALHALIEVLILEMTETPTVSNK